MSAVMDACRAATEIEDARFDAFVEIDYDLDDDCNSQEAVAGNDRKQRIRKPRKRRLGYIAPVVKHDIRRHYSRMLVNVVNSSNIPLLKSFMETYGALDTFVCSFEVDRDHSSYLSRYNSNVFFLKNLQEAMQFYTIRDRFLPDAVANLTNTRVVTRSDSEKCEIHCDMTVLVTVRYDFDMFALHDSLLSNTTHTTVSPTPIDDLNTQPIQSQDSGNDDDVMRIFRRHQPLSNSPYEDPFEMHFRKTGTHIPLHSNPFALIVKTSMIMVTNGRRQIERIHHGKGEVLVA